MPHPEREARKPGKRQMPPTAKPPVRGRALAVTRGKGKKKGLKKQGY